MAITTTSYDAIRGDTFELTISFKDGDLAQNITGWTIFFTLKNNIDDADADAVISKDVTQHTSPTAGVTQILLTAAETTDLNGSYYYDIQYKDTIGVIKTFLYGKITFTKDITRRIT